MALNLNTALNERIARVARKEIRANVGSTKRLASSQRRDVAALKRQVKDLTRRLAMLESISAKVGTQLPVKESKNLRFSPKSIRSQRRRLGLSAADFGKLVGISALSVYNYEQGKSRPRASQLAKLASVRGLGKREANLRLEGK